MKPKVGRNFTSERGEGVKGEVKNISLHWLQGIFETVPNNLYMYIIMCLLKQFPWVSKCSDVSIFLMDSFMFRYVFTLG